MLVESNLTDQINKIVPHLRNEIVKYTEPLIKESRAISVNSIVNFEYDFTYSSMITVGDLP